MTKDEKHRLARKIIKLTNEEIDDEHFIHQLLAESTLYSGPFCRLLGICYIVQCLFIMLDNGKFMAVETAF